jgi:electron transfer flavoprotein alpha/beta subunit
MVMSIDTATETLMKAALSLGLKQCILIADDDEGNLRVLCTTDVTLEHANWLADRLKHSILSAAETKAKSPEVINRWGVN